MDFNQYVRILVDTDVNTHFIVSLPRVSTVAELRELIKVTHKHCYPDTGDVRIGKLAVRGGDYGYHLADYLCIGQVYNTSEGKVMAEVQLPSLCAFGNDQKYLQSGPHELSTSSSPKKLQLLATENDNCNNEGQLCVEPQSAEKATNHSVGPSIPQLLERTIPAENQCRITAALEGNAITVHESKFVRSTVGCLGRENMSPATQAPFTQASRELMETPKVVEGEEDARDMETPSSRLVMQETQSDAGVAATGLLRKKKKEGTVKKRTVSLSEGEKQLEYLVEETDDVLVKAGSKKGKGFQFHTISKLQKKTAGIPASNIFKHEDETVSLIKVEGKNELQIKRNLELNNDNGASESTTHFSAQSKKKSDLSPAGSVSITTIQGKVKEKRKKKRALDVAEVKTMGETTLEGTLAVREVEPDTSVGGNVSVALNGDKLKEERRKKKFVELESSCVNNNQVRLGGEKVSELSANRQSEQEQAHKGHISGKRKVKVSKLHRSPTSDSLDAEAATNLQFSTSNDTQNNMAMNVNTEGNNVPDLRTVRKKSRRKQSMTDVLGVNGMTSMIIGFPEPGTVQAEGETAGENVQCTSQAHVAHALKERSREDGDKVSGSQQRGKEGEVMLTNDGSNVKDTGAGSDNREVAVLVGLSQAKAETLFEQAKDGFLQALDSLPGTPWPSGPVLVTKQGRGAPSGISTHEATFDMMEEVTAARRETGFQNKRYRSGKHDNEAQSLEREEATQTDVLRLAFETQADEQVDGLVLGNEGTLQNSNKSRKDSHSSKSSEGGEFRSDIALVKKTQVGVLDGKARESRVSQTNFPIGNGKAFQKQEVNIIENSPVERGEDNTEKDSAQALSQDTSYKVAATQVSNALSGSTTEETGEEIGLIWSKGTETQPHEQKVDALNSQLKDFIGLSHSAGENGNPDTILSAPAPSKAARTPLPIVPRIQASGIAENIRRRSSGAAAEIESKFAQFIDSQDGLDEIMDITFSQRKIRSADLTDQVASAGAIELPEAASSRSGNGVLENGGESMPPLSGVPVTLEKHKSAALLQVPGKSLVSLPTFEFKVPKAVLPSTTAGAENANHNSGGPTHNSGRSMLSTDVEVPIGFGSSTNLPKDVQENSGENQNFFAFEVQSMDADVTGSESLQLDWKNQSSSALQGTMEADTKKRSEAIVEKRRRLSKRKEDGLEFMVVNNTEQLVRDEMERKDSGEKRVDVESPATFLEFSGQQGDDDSKTNFWRTGANRKEEDNQSQDTSLVSGRRPGKKRRQSKVKREETEVGLNESELLVNNTVSSVDRATCEEDPKVAVINSRANDGDGLGHVIRGSDTMEMPDDGVKTTIEHDNVERESGQCEQVKGPTLLNQEKVQSDLDLSGFDSEDGDTLVSRIVKSGKKSGKRQAERMEEICERAVSRVLEDEMLHVADPDFVLQRKSRKDTNPTSWTSKKKGSNVSETMEGVKLALIQSTVTTKKASKSSKSGGTILKKIIAHKPVTDSGSEVCPMGCGKIYKGKTSAWYVHKSKCLGAPAD
ncbi:hypothetical protein BDL97_10G033300 [Sphagnum fallax]|nr:hypothetical protein BDL97_10G033300 [Sphagnum fallax]